jgi:hypothetical protein
MVKLSRFAKPPPLPPSSPLLLILSPFRYQYTVSPRKPVTFTAKVSKINLILCTGRKKKIRKVSYLSPVSPELQF